MAVSFPRFLHGVLSVFLLVLKSLFSFSLKIAFPRFHPCVEMHVPRSAVHA